MKAEKDISVYCELMREINRRIEVVNGFGSNRATLYRATNVECVYLQFRKILELIALGSLIANREEFKKAYSYFETCWKADLILKDVERINPDFYPQPVKESPSNMPGVKADFTERTDALTKAEFVKLYEKCGAIMHASNPYGSKIDYGLHWENIQMWLDKIMRLLASHKIRLVNDPNLYLVHMHDARLKDVVCYIFVPKG